MSTLLTSVLGFFTNVIWARSVPLDVYGKYQFLLASFAIAGSFCHLGASQASLMSAAQNSDGNFKHILNKKLLFNIFGTIFFFIYAFHYKYYLNTSDIYFYGLIIAGLIFPFFNLNDVWTAWLNGKTLFLSFGINRVLNYLISFFSVIIISYFELYLFWEIVIIYSLLICVHNIYVVKHIQSTIQNDKTDKSILRLGFHTSIALFVSSLSALDIIILNYFYGPTQVALYSIAFVLPELLRTALGIITQTYAPLIHNGSSPKKFWIKEKFNFLIIVLLFSFISIIGFFIIPLIFPIFFSEKYIDSIKYSQYLWIATSFLGPFGLLGKSIIATKKIIYTYLSHLGFPLIAIILYIFFINEGAEGLIKARIITMVVIHIFYTILFMKLVKK